MVSRDPNKALTDSTLTCNYFEISPPDSLTKLDTVQKTRSSNFTGGEQTGSSWTSKVMGVKQTQDVPPSLPQDTVEGADDEEWVCTEVM